MLICIGTCFVWLFNVVIHTGTCHATCFFAYQKKKKPKLKMERKRKRKLYAIKSIREKMLNWLNEVIMKMTESKRPNEIQNWNSSLSAFIASFVESFLNWCLHSKWMRMWSNETCILVSSTIAFDSFKWELWNVINSIKTFIFHCLYVIEWNQLGSRFSS